MFRQVVLQTWADGVTDEQKAELTRRIHALRTIPEVVAATGGADGGYFPDNWGLVSIIDFADFASARAYVTEPDHHVIAEGAGQLTERRAVVQYDWGRASVVGVHHVKLPVSDVAYSRHWYTRMLGFESDLEFVEEGKLRGVALRHPVAGVRLSLRHAPERAAALSGFDVICLAVGTRQDLGELIEGIRAQGGRPGPVVEGREGWACDLSDPDGLVVRLYTHERHQD